MKINKIKKTNNIGIITFHKAQNYGAVLQAYALQHFLKKISYNVEIIDYDSSVYLEYKHWFFNINQIKFQLSLLKNPSIKNFKDFLWRTIHLMFIHNNFTRRYKRKKAFAKFIRNNLNLTSDSYSYRKKEKLLNLNKKFDCIVCGSDQIWNFNLFPKSFDYSFCADFSTSSINRIAYAASIGDNDRTFNSCDVTRFCEELDKFNTISVRDNITKFTLEKSFSMDNLPLVVDPTLLLSAKDFDQFATSRIVHKPYIFVYALYQNEQMIKYINRLLKHNSYEIVYICENKPSNFFINNGRDYFGATVEEFVSLIKHADYVVTSSYHGVLLSIIYKKRFAYINEPKRCGRVSSILQQLNMENRINPSNIIVNDEISDFSIQILGKLKKYSKEFLSKVII